MELILCRTYFHLNSNLFRGSSSYNKENLLRNQGNQKMLLIFNEMYMKRISICKITTLRSKYLLYVVTIAFIFFLEKKKKDHFSNCLASHLPY